MREGGGGKDGKDGDKEGGRQGGREEGEWREGEGGKAGDREGKMLMEVESQVVDCMCFD